MVWVSLKEVGEVVTGNTPSKKIDKYYNSNDIPFIKPDAFSKDCIVNLSEALEYVSYLGAEKARKVKENSVLVTCIGNIGNIGITKREVCFNQQINAIVPNEKIINYKFLAYAIYYRKENLKAIANAPVVPIINKTEFSKFKIPLPPLETQHKIVAILDKAQALIDKRKEQLELMDKLVESVFYDMFGDPVKNDKGWGAKELEKVCEKITDGTHQPPKFVSKGIPFIFVSNILNRKINYNTNKFITEEDYNNLIKRTPIELGDILYTTVGSYGNPAVIKSTEKFCFQRHIAYLKLNSKIINSDFLSVLMMTSSFKREIDKRVKGVAQKTLNLKELKKSTVIFPPLLKQKQFANKVNLIEKQKETMQKSLMKMEEQFAGLMQKAFRGEIN